MQHRRALRLDADPRDNRKGRIMPISTRAVDVNSCYTIPFQLYRTQAGLRLDGNGKSRPLKE